MKSKKQIEEKIKELKIKALDYNYEKLKLQSLYDRDGSDLYVFYDDMENFVNQKIELLKWVISD